jgi:alkanesulfonate monooxygenase SsuD/methylene tetrahydromethanopterin reductase-like flavin-dependent oxidoreductase (luciferase family)
MPEWFLFLPQVRVGLPDILERAHAAEAAGFDGLALIDHLDPPGDPGHGIWEAMTTATWLAARTERLTIGHLVLCDAFRHPAVLAKQATTLSAASGGRFELGLGSGSWPQEFERYGVENGGDARARVERLGRDLELIRRYWGQEPDGAQEEDGAQLPLPPHPVPIVLGGTGPRTMELVRRHADWWNLPVHRIGELERLRPQAGTARVSVQQMVSLVTPGADRESVVGAATRRFGHLGAGLVCGDADELTAHFAGLAAQGVERFYVWFADFAAPATIAAFAADVAGAVRPVPIQERT